MSEYFVHELSFVDEGAGLSSDKSVGQKTYNEFKKETE